jgi:hypothetical protein
MATRQRAIRHDPNGLPLKAPPVGFYILGILALLTLVAVIYGFVKASVVFSG